MLDAAQKWGNKQPSKSNQLFKYRPSQADGKFRCLGIISKDQHPETAKSEASKCVHLAEAMIYLERVCIRIFYAVISYLFSFSSHFRL